jgi:hydrophobe/amphiphile efflux-3 (HAE3) family protein
MALAGAPLTMASVAVLPVLLGLGVDYAIQYQARVLERGGGRAGAAAAVAREAVPAIAVAALATVAGFLVLLLSPVPMVQGFGLLLIVGVGIAFACALTAGTALLVVLERRAGGEGPLRRAARGADELVGAAARRPAGGLARARGAMLRAARTHPGRILAVALVAATAGWIVDSQTEVRSDLPELVPQDLPAVRDLQTLQAATGVAGELDVVVEAPDVAEPTVVTWMQRFQQRVLEEARYSPDNGCGKAALCPALSLPDLFQGAGATGDAQRIDALLDAVPPYFSQAVITEDRRTANLAFGIRLMPLDEQHEVIERVRAVLDPPPGVTARVAGLPVLAAEANDALASPLRRLATLLAGLLAVLAVLALARGGLRRAWVPLVPIALATGWSALILFALRIPLNPMSATLGALVLALSTEFAVLLDARVRQERAAGLALPEALARAYRSTGAAILASGATAIAGFAVLALSDVRMLREFGIVTVVDLSVSLLGVLAVLPAVLVLVERRRPAPAPARTDPLVPA